VQTLRKASQAEMVLAFLRAERRGLNAAWVENAVAGDPGLLDNPQVCDEAENARRALLCGFADTKPAPERILTSLGGSRLTSSGGKGC
jgi:hypothetical protein